MKRNHNNCDVKTIEKVVSNIRRRSSNKKPQQRNNNTTDEKAQHYTSKAKKREEERALNIKKGVLAKFKKFAGEVIEKARVSAENLLLNYFQRMKDEELSFKIHSAEETAVLVEELNLQATVGEKEMIAATITISNGERIGADVGESVMKLTISEAKKDTRQALSKRNPRGIDGLKDANIVIIKDEQGQIMAIILREIIPIDLTKQFNLFREFYQTKNTLYTRGCRAATYPDVDDIMRCLKSADSRVAGGFRQTNVKQLHDIRVTRTGCNVMLYYKNRAGKTIGWAFTSNLDRKAFKRGDFVNSPFNSLLQFLEVTFRSVSEFWLKRHGCEEKKIDAELNRAMSKLHVTGGMIGQHKNRLGIHTDPSSKLATLVCGQTVYCYSDETGNWTERVCNGGRLVMIDGCIFLEYLPSDVVILNGNVLHSITALTDKKKSKEQSKSAHSRFSVQLYSDHNRGKNKHGKYGTFDCWW